MVAMATNSNITVPQKYTAKYKNVSYGWDTSHPTTLSKKFIILIYHHLHAVVRSRYQSDHPQSSSHFRQVCSNDTKVLPCFIGATFASPDSPTDRLLYVASMQVLYRPWKTWEDVMTWAEDWETSYADFYDQCSPFTRSCVHNTQLCRQARDAVDTEHMAEQTSDEDKLHE